MKVFVVMVNEYDEGFPVAVYSDKNEADRAAGLIEGGVAELVLDGAKLIDPGQDFFYVGMEKQGKVVVYCRSRLSNGEFDDAMLDETRKSSCRLCTSKDEKYVRKSHWRLRWKGYAENQEQAIEQADEIRRQILAGQRSAGVDMGKN